MDLTHTLSVEHADSQSPGCALHQDPSCLCDVDAALCTMGDTGYDMPAGMCEAWSSWESEDDGWFEEAFVRMTWDTLRKSFVTTPTEVWGLIEGHPSLVERLAQGETASRLAAEYAVAKDTCYDLQRFLNLAVRSKTMQGKRMEPVRILAVAMYDEGATAAEVYKALRVMGHDVKHPTVCKWMQRWSLRYLAERPETSLYVGVAA